VGLARAGHLGAEIAVDVIPIGLCGVRIERQ
jgi:hypothetical protein